MSSTDDAPVQAERSHIPIAPPAVPDVASTSAATAAGGAGGGSNGQSGISAAEIALYDRQIRLWGVAAQERLRGSRTLLVSLPALADEVVKNLVLAGVGSLTLLDDALVTVDDFAARFLLRPADIGQQRAQAVAKHAAVLNPRVKLDVVAGAVDAQSDDFLGGFDCVLAIGQPLAVLRRLNAVCRAHKRAFYAAECPGLFGFAFADLGEVHGFVVERELVDAATKERRKTTVALQESFVTLDTALASSFAATLRPKQRKRIEPLLPCFLALLAWRESRSDAELASFTDEFAALVAEKAAQLGLEAAHVPRSVVDAFAANVGEELSAVVSIVGGVLAQDILNVIGGRELPLQNTLIYNGDTAEGPIYKLA